MEFEVCIDSVNGAIAAGKYGAKRVELCSALSEGGLTPSPGMIAACATQGTAEVFVMIRPSAGGFNYSDQELLIMQKDIELAHQCGADGVVFGVLNTELTIDIQKNAFLLETAFRLELGTTFHRAIDLCPAPEKAVDDLVNLGFDRILTSGGKPKAAEGIATIQKMNQAAKNRIEIMAGSGVNPSNVAEFVGIGINAVHFTAHKKRAERLALDMGPKYDVDEEKIQLISNQLNK